MLEWLDERGNKEDNDNDTSISLSGKGQSGIASGVFPPHDVPKSFTWGMKTRSNKYHAPS